MIRTAMIPSPEGRYMMVRTWVCRRLSGIAAILALLMAVPAGAGDLGITIHTVQSTAGSLMIGVYDTGDGFRGAIRTSTAAGLLNDRARVAGVALRAVAGSQTIVVVGLLPGRYAVIAFHDDNDDGKLGASPWGVPTEGYGFSNDAQGFLRAPSFAAASFEIGESGSTTTTITLIYPQTSPRHDQFVDKSKD
jgi:uncharacterized protein (DUF2141 family)